MIATRPRAETHSNSKLTWKAINEIRSKYIPYKYSCAKLSKEYDVHPTTIHAIIKNEIWRDPS